MRKLICLSLSVLLLLSLAVCAQAAEFTLEEYETIDGMSRSWYQGYSPTIKKHVMTICLPLRAENCVGDITVSLALDDPNLFVLEQQPSAVTVSPKNGIYPVKLSLTLEKYRRNGDFPATITITGKNAAGEELKQSMPYVIRIRDGYGNLETLKPVLSEITTELDVGTDGTFCLTITNPTTTQSMVNGTITVTDASGEILMRGSNRVQIGEILPGKSERVTIPMTVKGNASITPHTLEVQFDYQALGKTAQWTERFTVPVTQAIRLEQGGVQMPTAIAGELGSLTLPLMNMGKGELSNVLVKLAMEDVLDEQSVLVGTMAAGETKSAKLTFTPKLDSVGLHSGTVTVTCEDAYGNAFSQTLDVTLTVDEPIPQVETEESEQKQTDAGKIVLMVLCVLLAGALAIQGKILTDKLHKLEEERL